MLTFKQFLQEHLLVAIRHRGKIHVGKLGDIHSDLATRINGNNYDSGMEDGFVSHDNHNHFMDRHQAYKHVMNKEKKIFPYLNNFDKIDGLESHSYVRATKKAKKNVSR